MSKYDEYLKAKRDYEEAVEWNNLPHGQKYQNDKMDISTAHCELKLVRAGQQSQGGKNYWDSPKALNSVILETISTRDEIIDFAIHRLADKVTQALADCEQETLERMEAINKAKQEIAEKI